MKCSAMRERVEQEVRSWEKHSIPMLQSRSNCLEKHHKCDTIGWRWSDMAGSAHPLQRQYSRLSRLPKASAVSVARASHHKAASDQCPTPSAPRWFRAAALAGLESERTAARLYAARAAPTHRGEPAASRCNFVTQPRSDPFPRAACPCSPLVGRTLRSQRTSPNSQSSDDQTIRRPQRLCHLARFGDGLTPSEEP